MRVLLDPGHGAQDIGAMGVAGTSAPCEKDVNLAVALAAREQLEAMGATVLMTREDDSFPTLVERNQRIIEMCIRDSKDSVPYAASFRES